MRMVERRMVEAVLIAKLDRATRSLADLGQLLETFGRRHVALVSAAESLDTSTANGRFTVGILGLVASWERGGYRGSARPTPCRNSRARDVLPGAWRRTAPSSVDGRRVDDDAELATLAAMRRHRAAGHSWQGVADGLNADGHRTRRGGRWSRQGAQQVFVKAAA